MPKLATEEPKWRCTTSDLSKLNVKLQYHWRALTAPDRLFLRLPEVKLKCHKRETAREDLERKKFFDVTADSGPLSFPKKKKNPSNDEAGPDNAIL
jgi:hypothetical protein